MRQKHVSPGREIVPLLFVSLAADGVVRPFVAPDGVSAQSSVWALAASASVVCIWISVFFRGTSDSALRLLRSGSLMQAKAVLLLFVLTTALAGGASLVTTERFYRYVSDEPTLSLVTAILVLLASLYAVSRGILTLTRAGGVVSALFVLGAILLVASSLHSMRLENLQYAQKPFADAAQSVLYSGIFPAELLCFLLFKFPMKHNGALCARRAVVFAALFLMGAVVLAELVLGQRASEQLQPLHTLARLGGLSVFKRFDALHVGIWLLALLARQSLLLYGTRTAVRGLLPKRMDEMCLPCAVALTIAGAFVSAGISQRAVEIIVSAGTFAGISGALLFSRCMEEKV